MSETGGSPGSTERAFWSWLGFWVQLLILAILVVIGAFFASGAERPGDYACGIVLILSALALAFLRLHARLDGAEARWGELLLIRDMWNLALVVPLFTVIGLAGLFIAHAWEQSALHAAGIALFIISGVIVFFDIKHVFDHIDRSPR
jgi:fermentation-respiration switch protein FrsA (DUF1100 family)